MEFRERLYQLRKGRGISQEELARKCGVSRQTVNAIGIHQKLKRYFIF